MKNAFAGKNLDAVSDLVESQNQHFGIWNVVRFYYSLHDGNKENLKNKTKIQNKYYSRPKHDAIPPNNNEVKLLLFVFILARNEFFLRIRFLHNA